MSLRKAARSLIDREGWDATEDAVVSALRRHSPTLANVPPIRDLLGGGRITTRSGTSVYAIRWTPDTTRRLSRVLNTGDVARPGVLRLISGNGRTLVVAGHEVAAMVREHLGDAIEGSRTGVTEVKLHLPNVSAQAAGALSVVLHVLSQRGITPLGVASHPPDHVLLVEQEDTIEAYGVLSKLITE